MNLRPKVLLGILVALILVNGALIVYDIKKEIQDNREVSQKDQQMNDQVLKNIYKQLKEMNQKIDKNYNDLNTQLINLPERERIKKITLEQKLKFINVEIRNMTLGALGSGVSIKYKDKFYILSAGHMATPSKPKEEPERLELWEKGSKICELEIVKHDFSTREQEEFTKGNDLILLRPKDKNFKPKYYTELADFEPLTSSEIYIVGNPMGIEDVLCEGRVIRYYDNFVYYINHTYYGNSGGGVYTSDGKLVGIVSHMYPIQPNPGIPPYMTYGAVRLDVIKEFLKDVM